ncbi:MAG: primosomal protein N', partial [Wenzhouxiangellaceae bacterium]
MTDCIVRVALAVPLFRLFDYRTEAAPAPPVGSRVVVPFGKRSVIGVVVEHASGSELAAEKLKPVEQVLDPALVGPEPLSLLRWAVRYYAAPPGEIVNHALPALLRRPVERPAPRRSWLKLAAADAAQQVERAPRQQEVIEQLELGARSRASLIEAGIRPEILRTMLERGLIEPTLPGAIEPVPGPCLNPAQRKAVAAILAARNRFQVLALAGVTGSGKTEVYLQAARRMLQRHRQVLVLVPEIGLTAQFVRRLESRLGRAAWIYHSGLGPRERFETWQAASDGDAELLVGTRSAVFLPLNNPGLIVVDEEHDSSFKQFDGLRYHARDVAVMRASRLGIPVVLGSATPSLETLFNARQQRYRLLELRERVGDTVLPHWRVEDLRGQKHPDGLTDGLIERIRATVEAGEQVLIYRNRRGFAPLLICDECGWQADCTHCSAHLTLHQHTRRLVCHHCGHRQAVPGRCPGCQSPRLTAIGAGTERIEAALAERLPEIPLLRFDRDVVRGRAEFDRRMAEAASGRPCILIGTRMLAKGHHLPKIGLAVMLDIDAMLFSADFRAPERLAQDAIQVAGRAGRAKPGLFILMTRHPEHPMIELLAGGNYMQAAHTLLDRRLEAGLPPARNLAMVRAEAQRPEQARNLLEQIARQVTNPDIEVAGPLEALLQRRAGHWRFQLWLISRSRPHLSRALEQLIPAIEAMPAARKLRWHIDVDPL